MSEKIYINMMNSLQYLLKKVTHPCFLQSKIHVNLFKIHAILLCFGMYSAILYGLFKLF